MSRTLIGAKLLSYAVLVSVISCLLVACSGDVEVRGVPKRIALDVPFCVPDEVESVDGGVDGAN